MQKPEFFDRGLPNKGPLWTPGILREFGIIQWLFSEIPLENGTLNFGAKAVHGCSRKQTAKLSSAPPNPCVSYSTVDGVERNPTPGPSLVQDFLNAT